MASRSTKYRRKIEYIRALRTTGHTFQSSGFVNATSSVMRFCRPGNRRTCKKLMLRWSAKMVCRYLDSKSVLLVNFLFALVNVFLLVMHLNVRIPPAEAYFYSPLTVDEREEMLNLVRVFATEMEKHNIMFFIGSGTLLGSVRHHGPIPWDDDVDVFVEKSDLPRLKKVISAMKPAFRLHPGDALSPALKFYAPSSGRRFLHHHFTWPYVDIFLLTGNATHFDTPELFSQPVKRSRIFPLVRRPYQGLWLPAPCDSKYLLSDYNIDECHSRRFSHVMELPMLSWTQRHVPCTRLYHLFPFVHRQMMRQTGNVLKVREILKIDAWTLSNFTIASPEHCDGRVGVFAE